jgi:hypothetical protein
VTPGWGWVLVALISLGAGPAAAQGQPQEVDAARPTFLIETITVENSRKFQAGIVLSESLLREGQSYTEGELRDAVYRIVRLPLILDADFELRKGSERDKYELVITVTEARRWFFGIQNSTTFWAEEVSIEGLETTDRTVADMSVVGYRVPVGAHGLFFVTAGGSDGGFQLGYEQFNLFDKNVLLSVKVGLTACDEVRERADSGDLGEDGCATEIFALGLDPAFSTWTILGDQATARLNLVVPIRGNHSVRFRSSARSADVGLRRSAFDPTPEGAFFFEHRDELELGLSWVYNSQDDSIFPTRGRLLEGGLEFRSLDSRMFQVPPGPKLPPEPLISIEQDSEELRAFVAGRAYWPKSRKTTLWAGVDGFLGLADVTGLPLPDRSVLDDDLQTFGAAISAGHSQFLWRVINGKPKHPKRRPRWRELRWENELQLFYDGTSPSLGLPDNPHRGLRLGSGLSFRNTWGIFRVQLSYLDVMGDR